MDLLSAESPIDRREELVSTDLDALSAAGSENVGGSPNNEIVKDCPLCKATIRYVFVNFNEKVLLCENRDCEYPFGYEDLQFIKQDEQCGTEDEVESIATEMTRQRPTGSVISTNGWSDIEKLNKAYDSEDSQQESILSNRQEIVVDSDAKSKCLKERQLEVQTKKNVQQIKKLNVQLQKTYDEEQISCIKNETWIKHLMKLQGMSGVQLLKKEEMSRIRRAPAALGPGQLTIGIGRAHSMSSITIQLSNNAEASTSGS